MSFTAECRYLDQLRSRLSKVFLSVTFVAASKSAPYLMTIATHSVDPPRAAVCIGVTSSYVFEGDPDNTIISYENIINNTLV